MERLEGKTFNVVQDNIDKLKELFPEAFTENKVDIDKLRLALGEHVETEKERYEFTWNGKIEAIQLAQKQTTGTLRPNKEESVDWDTTQNIYIEGDNLEVLRILQGSYRNKVKMIYIDPPYNTGKDFVYKDNFHDNVKSYTEQLADNMKSNAETNGRFHTDWLNMMYPRLKIAKNLLKEDGVIFISIDDNEITNLRKVCDEIFGEENFITQFIWKSKLGKVGTTNHISDVHEYILFYSKNKSLLNVKQIVTESDGRKENLRQWGQNDRREDRPSMFFPITVDGVEVFPIKNDGTEGRWRVGKEMATELLNSGFLELSINNGKKEIYRHFPPGLSVTPYSSIIPEEVGTTANGSRSLTSLGLNKVFDYSKSVELISFFIEIATNTEDIILDFFSGSSTTAQAVLEKNLNDGGSRRFILVQLPEITDKKSEAYKAGYKTISDIGKERIRRVGQKVIQENSNKDGTDKLDIGFKVFKLDETNLKVWDEKSIDLEKNLLDLVEPIKPKRTQEDVVYEILLKYGIELTTPIEELIINGKSVFSVGMGYLLICLERDLSLEQIEEMAKQQPARIVFYDEGFKNDTVRTNAQQILKRYGVEDIRVI